MNHPPSFQDGVAQVLMATEELRQQVFKSTPITSHSCLQVRHGVEELMPALFSLAPSDDIEGDLRKHCQQRVAAVALQAFELVVQKEEEISDDNNTSSLQQDCQAAIARIAELNLVLHQGNDEKLSEIITKYVNYQRQVIRQRSKPAIARLVAYRKRLQQQKSLIGREIEEDEEESSKSQHSHVITEILGQASALIHPLIMWNSNLPPDLIYLNRLCQSAICTLDEQAQNLTKTVATWFLEDRHVDEEWMSKCANETPCAKSQLGELDGVVEELAFCCQVFDRYIALMKGFESSSSTAETKIIQEFHPEWTWKYASLERYLTHQQLQSALAIASPVQIVLGSPIQVSSVVEDAQYLSMRALERSASTRSMQAIGTVAHAVTNDVWSTEIRSGVHEALVDQKGCWQDPTQNSSSEQTPSKEAKPSSSSFAQALSGAVDEDLSTPNKASSTPTSSKSAGAPSSGTYRSPSSGTFLGSLSSLGGGGGDKFRAIRMDTYFCALNGVHSASTACDSLVQFLDSLLPVDDEQEETTTKEDKHSTMIQLAREELFRYSKNYQDFLREQVQKVVTEFCGSFQDAPVYRGTFCIPVLRYNLERENYALSSAEELKTAEDDARLYAKLIQPLAESKFLQQFQKCDAEVLREICEALATLLVDLFLDCITVQGSPLKQFTDWGSLLLSKQVRIVQNYITTLMEKALVSLEQEQGIPILPQWERLSQVVNVLQLERPSDWIEFYADSSVLSTEELDRILRLRADFSGDAIAAIVAQCRQEKQ